MPDQAQLICESLPKKHLYTSIPLHIPEVLEFRDLPQSNRSRAFWAKTQDLNFCMELGMESQVSQ